MSTYLQITISKSIIMNDTWYVYARARIGSEHPVDLLFVVRVLRELATSMYFAYDNFLYLTDITY